MSRLSRSPCLDTAGRIEHGLEKQSVDNIGNSAETFSFSNAKLKDFCNEVRKDEYRNEFTQGYFSQSSFKEVTCSAVRSTEILTRGGSPSMHSMDPEQFLAIKKYPISVQISYRLFHMTIIDNLN